MLLAASSAAQMDIPLVGSMRTKGKGLIRKREEPILKLVTFLISSETRKKNTLLTCLGI